MKGRIRNVIGDSVDVEYELNQTPLDILKIAAKDHPDMIRSCFNAGMSIEKFISGEDHLDTENSGFAIFNDAQNVVPLDFHVPLSEQLDINNVKVKCEDDVMTFLVNAVMVIG